MVDIHNLSKKFGQTFAVQNLSFSLKPGSVLGFVGPNGAGKTTTMRMLTGYIPPTEGRISIQGFDVMSQPMEVRRIVGYLPETPPLYRELTIGSYLEFVASIREVEKPQKRIAEVMEEVGLEGWERRIIASLSKGYRQRVGLAQAIIHKPQLLILDEPTSGLDPRQMVGVRRFIKRLSADRTVILSTHILSQLEDICDQILVLQQGERVAFGSPQEIAEHAGGKRVRITFAQTSKEYIDILANYEGVSKISLLHEDANECIFEVFSSDENIQSALFQMAKQMDWPIQEMYHYTPSLEEAFLNIVGEEG